MTGDQAVGMHLLGRLEIGGAERMLLSLCRAMPTAEFSQSVVALSGESGWLTAEFASAGAPEVLCGLTPILSVLPLAAQQGVPTDPAGHRGLACRLGVRLPARAGALVGSRAQNRRLPQRW